MPATDLHGFSSAAVPLLKVEGISKHYLLPRTRLWAAAPRVQALHDIGFTLDAGRTLGVVGESGSGKSTLARIVMALERPDTGRVWLQGRDLHAMPPAELRRARAGFQMVFQDPYGSLDPRQSVGRIVAEPLTELPADERRHRVAQVLGEVGLRAADADKYPHEFSGGQRQRIAIARALITRPQLIVADEPVSALDVSIQAQVLNLLQDLQQQFGIAYLFISHDLAVIHHLCDQVVVMQAGRVVERGATEQVFNAPTHAYTRSLLDAMPMMPVTADGVAPAHVSA